MSVSFLQSMEKPKALEDHALSLTHENTITLAKIDAKAGLFFGLVKKPENSLQMIIAISKAVVDACSRVDAFKGSSHAALKMIHANLNEASEQLKAQVKGTSKETLIVLRQIDSDFAMALGAVAASLNETSKRRQVALILDRHATSAEQSKLNKEIADLLKPYNEQDVLDDPQMLEFETRLKILLTIDRVKQLKMLRPNELVSALTDNGCRLCDFEPPVYQGQTVFKVGNILGRELFAKICTSYQRFVKFSEANTAKKAEGSGRGAKEKDMPAASSLAEKTMSDQDWDRLVASCNEVAQEVGKLESKIVAVNDWDDLL